MDKEKIRNAILTEAGKCKENRSVTPVIVAKTLDQDERIWRRELHRVKRVAIEMAQAGEIEILRKGKVQDPFGDIRGILRLRLPPKAQD